MSWFRIRSFADRLSRRIMVVMILTMSINSGIIFFWSMGSMSLMTYSHYEEILKLTNEHVQKILTGVEIAAINNAGELEQHISSPEQTSKALKKELNFNPHILGCSVSFIPDYFPQKGHWYETYAKWEDSCHVATREIGSKTHDYTKKDWFCKPLMEGTGYWSEPYYDEAGAKDMLCTYSLPIHDTKGEIVAVYGADISLGWLQKQLEEIDKKEKEYSFALDASIGPYSPFCFIIGRNGKYIAHPDSKKILTQSFIDELKSKPHTADDKLINKILKGEAGKEFTEIGGFKSFIFYQTIEKTGWTIFVAVPSITMRFYGIILACLNILTLTVGMMLVFLICYFSIRHITKPLKQLSVSANEVAKGNFETPLPDIKHDDEIKVLRNSFGSMQKSLAQYIEELKTTTAQKAAIESELNIARNIQMAMLPKTYPPYPERTDIDIYGILAPAKAVGGDLFDFFIRDEKLFFCVGDVSGKGIPAALVMTVIRSLFRNVSAHISEPEQVVEALNETLVDNNETQMFATLFMGILNLKDGQLSYCNAGHESPLLIGPGIDTLSCDPNLPIGVLPGWTFTKQQATIASQTTLFIYTDGLNEAEDVNHAQFGIERIKETASAVLAKNENEASTLVKEMQQAVLQFADKAEQSDDLTLLAIKYIK